MPIIVQADAYSDADLEELVDEDLVSFSTYFQSLGNDPLSKFESSIIKTYLHWKTHDAPGSPAPPTTTEGTNA